MTMIALVGNAEVWVNGELVHRSKNRITEQGLEYFAQLVAATATQLRIKAIAAASGVTPTTATQTALSQAEKRRARTALSRTSNVLTFTATFVGLQANIREMGIFNATATGGGKMVARWLTALIPLTTGDRARVSWRVQFGTEG